MACGRRMSSSSTSTSTAAHAAPTPSWRRRWAEWNGKYRDHIRRFIKHPQLLLTVHPWCRHWSPSHLPCSLPYHFPLSPPLLEVDDLPHDV
uniref:Uncharacterized protein n=1 Tax=Triticum urartu TaxID=4572 RepID=A0A8R7QA44_TRIUA